MKSGKRNGRVLSDTTAQVFYCDVCHAYRGQTGRRVGYEDPDLIVWIECDWCVERRLREEALEGERRRREEERSRPRPCALEGCSVIFVPAADHQLYCSDEHRWKAHRAVRRVNGHDSLSPVKR